MKVELRITQETLKQENTVSRSDRQTYHLTTIQSIRTHSCEVSDYLLTNDERSKND